jgi:polysaccharide pyruvyl transferase WcaK-like protein
MVAIHASYFGDNFGDTLFVIQYVDYLIKQGVKPEEITLPFAGKRARSYVEVSSLKGITAIAKSDKVVFIGGGYFGERKFQKTIWHLRFWVRHISVALLAKIFRRPYVFLGVGAGPLNNVISKKLVKYVINNSEGFYARDRISYEFLNDFCSNDKVFLAADSLISYNEHRNDEKLVKNKILFHLPLKEGMHKPLKLLMPLIKEVFKENYKVVVARDFYKPSFNVIDLEIIREFYPNVEYVEYENPKLFLNLLNTCQFIFTVKLHAGILGLGAGRKVFSTYVHEKTHRFYKQANLSHFCFDYFQIDDKQKEIKDALIQFRDSIDKTEIPKEILKLSEKNFIVLDLFLKNEN